MDISAALSLRPPPSDRGSPVTPRDTAPDRRSFSDELDQASAREQAAQPTSRATRPRDSAQDDSPPDQIPDRDAEAAPDAIQVGDGAAAAGPAISTALANAMAADQAESAAATSQAQIAAQPGNGTPVPPVMAASVQQIQTAPIPGANANAAPAQDKANPLVANAAAQGSQQLGATPGVNAESAANATSAASEAHAAEKDALAAAAKTEPANAPPVPGLLLQAVMTAPQLAQRPAPAKPASAEKTAGGEPNVAAPPAVTASAQTGAAAQTATPAAAVEGLKQDAPKQDGASSGGAQIQTAHTAAPKDIKLEGLVAAPQPAPAPPPAQTQQAAPALVPHSAPVMVPPEALAATIARKAMDGANRFEIRLDPVELGRLDVTIEVDESGHTRAHIRAERPEALELLQRDAKGMEQALRQAGLQTDQSSLTFSLAERHKQDGGEHAGHGRKAKFHAVLPADEINAAAIAGRNPAASGLDLRV